MVFEGACPDYRKAEFEAGRVQPFPRHQGRMVVITAFRCYTESKRFILWRDGD